MKVRIIGVGGAAVRILDKMIMARDLPGGIFAAVDSDPYLPANSLSEIQIHLDMRVPGFYNGGNPKIGEQKALEKEESIRKELGGTRCGILVTALGGGIGTGASPVIARILKKSGAKVAAVATLPYDFEGGKRMRIAMEGMNALARIVDVLMIHRNEIKDPELRRHLRLPDAWRMSDDAVSLMVKKADSGLSRE
ncbi:MAG: hypothetical protein C4529_04850 [Deltaproteobacteria bacterium]|nr:MAG: hypothetical protein C4529_04850 [Deltaproteobacteria bacterium]